MNYLYYLYVQFLSQYNISGIVAMLTFPLIPFIIVSAVMTLIVLILVLMERKVLALFTQRKGPNRVGPWGILQTVADALKLLCKENIGIKGSEKLIFNFAPILAFVPVLVVWGLIPYSSEFEFMSFSVSALLFLTIASIPVMAIFLAGYASNNKYSMLGAIRSVAQSISYELPMMFVLLSVAVLASSLNLKDIVLSQTSAYPFCGWFIFPLFLGFIIMFIAIVAELNRCPFDLPEAESELVSGYNTEYSGMRFALFFLAEYAMLFAACAFMVTVFFGGFLSPLGFYLAEKIALPLHWINLLVYFEQVYWLILKTFVLIFLIMWVRATLPRLSADKLMAFSWKLLLPLSILNFLFVCIFKYFANWRIGL